MKNIKVYVRLFIALAAVIILSNFITAKYIEDKVRDDILSESWQLRNAINQLNSNISSVNRNVNKKTEKSWNDVMAPTELAEYLDIELDMVYDIIDDKESNIPYLCIDGAYRFSKTAIDEWLASRNSIIINSIR